MKKKESQAAAPVPPASDLPSRAPFLLPWFLLAYVSLLVMIGMSIIFFRDWVWLYVFLWRGGWMRFSAWGVSALHLAPGGLPGALFGSVCWVALGLLLW